MRQRSIVLSLALVVAALPGPALAAAKPKTDATLRQDLARLAAGAGGQGGFVVLDAKSGKTLAAASPGTARPLGSTAKVVTTSVAAYRLRAGLTTTVATGAAIDPATGTLNGDLVLHGGGDPTLGDAQLAVLADAVQAHGIRAIAGAVVGDESALDTWRGPSGDAFDPEIGGVLGALTYDRGRQAPGGPLQPDPARAAAFRFDDVLEARGLQVRGTPRATASPASPASPGALVELGRVTTPIARVIKIINKTSDDFGAEILAKDIGVLGLARSGSTIAGATEIGDIARLRGAALKLVDGSGVDRRTKGSPRQLAHYVRLIRTDRTIAASLPIAGVDGTLAQRMTSGPARRACRAKTGSLPQTRVSALAGWCRTHGRTLVFAFLRERVDQAPAKAAEDAMVQRVAASRRR
jgi:D-alanyl-D-alanine carboxypeptidase/D-alanyl-D-alanine-endopeptidase (penicillin-binding protein 4)